MADDSGTYSVRLEDGQSSWSNASGLYASREDPVITGLSEDSANHLVAEHPFEHIDSEAADALDEATPDVAANDAMPATTPGDSNESDGDADADNDAESGDSESKSEDDDADPKETDLESIEGVGPATANKLRDAGFESVSDVRSAGVDDLAATGISERIAHNIVSAIRGGEE